MVKVPQIKRLLIEDFKLGIDELNRQLNSTNIFHNDFLEIKGRFNQLEKEKNRGIIDHNTYNIELNKLRIAIISLTDKIQKQQSDYQSQKLGIISIKTESKKTNTKIYLTLLLILVLIGLFGVIGYSKYPTNSSNKSEEIKTVLNSYYKSLISKNFSSLGEFYSDPIERYYNQKNIYFDDVIEDLKKSKKNVTEEKIEVDWNTFDVKKDNNLYHLDYNITYQRKNISGNWSNYKLRIRVILDSNLKIKSIYEIKE